MAFLPQGTAPPSDRQTNRSHIHTPIIETTIECRDIGRVITMGHATNWLTVVELWHSVRNKALLVHHNDMQSVNVHDTRQDTWSGHLQIIPMTGRAMDDTAITDTTTDYRAQDGTPVTVQSPCFAIDSFIHLHWLHNDLIVSQWQLPFNKAGQIARRFPIKWEPKGPSWAIRALCRWYTRCIPISREGMGPQARQVFGAIMMTSVAGPL